MRNRSDTIDNYTIKLSQYLSGTCPYKGCKYNDGNGYCSNEDEEFLDNIHISASENINDDIECQPSISDGVCKWCGGELKSTIDYVPYGDTEVQMETWYCPRC